MDQRYGRERKNDLGYGAVLVAVLVVLVGSLVLQVLALKDEGQVALAQAAQALVAGKAADAVKVRAQERKS